jgi:hypothetical protein
MGQEDKGDRGDELLSPVVESRDAVLPVGDADLGSADLDDGVNTHPLFQLLRFCACLLFLSNIFAVDRYPSEPPHTADLIEGQNAGAGVGEYVGDAILSHQPRNSSAGIDAMVV